MCRGGGRQESWDALKAFQRPFMILQVDGCDYCLGPKMFFFEITFSLTPPLNSHVAFCLRQNPVCFPLTLFLCAALHSL